MDRSTEDTLQQEVRRSLARERREKLCFIGKTVAVYALVAAVIALAVAVCREADARAAAEGRVVQLEQELAAEKAALDTVTSRLEEAEERVGFWDASGVVVPRDSRVYHRSTCPTLAAGTEVFIYSVEIAAYRAFTPCEVCRPPVIDKLTTLYSVLK